MSYFVGFIFSSLGAGEILFVLVVALLLFGAERLPSIARAMGQALNEMRRSLNELSSAVTNQDLLSSSDQTVSEQRDREEKKKDRREG